MELVVYPPVLWIRLMARRRVVQARTSVKFLLETFVELAMSGLGCIQRPSPVHHPPGLAMIWSGFLYQQSC